jgi:FtsZ-binding cell division protein ZapB
MSYLTGYTFKNGSNTVDIGTVFCDLTNAQTIGGNKTMSGSLGFANSNGATISGVNGNSLNFSGACGFANNTAFLQGINIYGASTTTTSISGSYAYWNCSSTPSASSGASTGGRTNAYGLYIASGGIGMGGGQIDIASDKRIKKDIVTIDPSYSLNIIRNITPVNFKYIETNNSDVGFIAQEIEKHIPEAVNTNFNAIPNILLYGKINKLKPETYSITLTDKIDISSIQTLPVPIKCKKTDTDNFNTENCLLVEIINNQTLIVNGKLDNIIENDTIYVYGIIVDDFKLINKNIIFTYAVSSIQKLDAEIAALKEENKTLKAQIMELQEFKNNFQDISNQIKDIKQFLKM